MMFCHETSFKHKTKTFFRARARLLGSKPCHLKRYISSVTLSPKNNLQIELFQPPETYVFKMSEEGGVPKKSIEFFFNHPDGRCLWRPVRVLYVRAEPFVLHEDVCAAFGFEPEAGLAISKIYENDFTCDQELYLVNTDYSYIALGCLPDEEEQPAEDTTPLLTPPTKNPQDVIDLCESPTKGSFHTPLSLSPASVIETPVANLSKTAFKYADAFPEGTVFSATVPADVDGDVTYGCHFEENFEKDERGVSLSSLPYFQVNRSWRHATRWTFKTVTDKWTALKATSAVRKMKCLGEGVCENVECGFNKIHSKKFVEKVILRQNLLLDSTKIYCHR